MLLILKILFVSSVFGLCWSATINERGECLDPPEVRQIELRRPNGTRARVAWTNIWPDCGRLPLFGPPRVAGGFTAKPGEYPAYVRVDIYYGTKSLMCGGTLISDRHVLTAFHCFTNKQYTRVDVVTTSFRADYKPQHVYEVHAVCHTTHTDEFLEDFAILTLKRRVRLDKYVQPACLASTLAKGAANFRAVGLGRTSGAPIHAEQLQVLPVKWSQCEPSDQHPSKVCFVPSSSRHVGDTCAGDSGGPVFGLENGRLTVFGVTSYGPLVCQAGVAGYSVNANVHNLRADIDHVIKRCPTK